MEGGWRCRALLWSSDSGFFTEHRGFGPLRRVSASSGPFRSMVNGCTESAPKRRLGRRGSALACRGVARLLGGRWRLSLAVLQQQPSAGWVSCVLRDPRRDGSQAGSRPRGSLPAFGLPFCCLGRTARDCLAAPKGLAVSVLGAAARAEQSSPPLSAAQLWGWSQPEPAGAAQAARVAASSVAPEGRVCLSPCEGGVLLSSAPAAPAGASASALPGFRRQQRQPGAERPEMGCG